MVASSIGGSLGLTTTMSGVEGAGSEVWLFCFEFDIGECETGGVSAVLTVSAAIEDMLLALLGVGARSVGLGRPESRFDDLRLKDEKSLR